MHRFHTAISVLIAITTCSLCQNRLDAQVAMARAVPPRQDVISMWALRGKTETQIAETFQADSELQLDFVDRICGLDDRQKSKLALAANADISRFLRQCDSVRAQLNELGLNDMNEIQKDMAQQQIAIQLVQPLMMVTQGGIHGDDSLLQRVLATALSEQQRVAYETEMERIHKRRIQAIVRSNVADLELLMPLRDDQRQHLLSLLDDVEGKIRGDQPNLAQFEAYIGVLKLLKVDRDELARFLDEQQLDVVDKYIQQYRGLEQFLE